MEKKYRVTFELPPDVNAKNVTLSGKFNNWDKESLPMKQRNNGSFYVSLTLETGRKYRFRY